MTNENDTNDTFFQVTILLELRYRSPLEGNEDSDEDLEDDEDEEEFIPNVGLVSTSQKRGRSVKPDENIEGSGHALIALEENIAKLEQSILSSNNNHAAMSQEQPQVRFSGSSLRISSSQGKIRRSTSLNEDSESDFGHKKKRTFNFTNLKKRYN